VQQLTTQLVLGPPRQLVGEHDVAHAQLLAVADLQQLGAGGERVAQRGVVLDDPVAPDRVLVDDETAPDGEVGPLCQQTRAKAEGPEDHAVGMSGQTPAAVQGDVVAAGEGYGAVAGEPELAGLGHPGHVVIGVVSIDRLRPVALQPEDDGLVRPVPAPGRAQGPEELGPDALYLVQKVRVAQPIHELTGGTHRPHRVGGRRADADREHVQSAERHQGSSGT
jgi:hypothetical protein